MKHVKTALIAQVKVQLLLICPFIANFSHAHFAISLLMSWSQKKIHFLCNNAFQSMCNVSVWVGSSQDRVHWGNELIWDGFSSRDRHSGKSSDDFIRKIISSYCTLYDWGTGGAICALGITPWVNVFYFHTQTY